MKFLTHLECFKMMKDVVHVICIAIAHTPPPLYMIKEYSTPVSSKDDILFFDSKIRNENFYRG